MRQLIIDAASVALFVIVILIGMCSSAWKLIQWYQGRGKKPDDEVESKSCSGLCAKDCPRKDVWSINPETV